MENTSTIIKTKLKYLTAVVIACSFPYNAYSADEKLYDSHLQIYQSDNLNKIASTDDYLNTYAKELGIASENFQLKSVQNSLTAKHFHYQQHANGIAIENALLSISVSHLNGALIKTHSHVVNNKNLVISQSDYQKTSDEALNIAWNNLRAQGKLHAKPSIQKVFYPTKKGLVAVYRVEISLSKPAGDWVQYIDGQSGRVIQLEQKRINEKNDYIQHNYQPDHFSQVDSLLTKPLTQALEKLEAQHKSKIDVTSKATLVAGSGTVFDPDPKTSLSDDTLKDDSAAGLFVPAYVTKTFPEVTLLNGTYSLKSSWAEISDFDSPSSAPATSTDGNWSFVRGQNGFDDATVFFHLDDNQRYIQSLGFKDSTGIQYGVIRADANGANGADNSFYSPGNNTVSFGHGGVNDSEDADVILHEYGHAINYSINSSWGGPDAGAIGEGFGDYWAGSYSTSTTNGATFFPNKVFTWDGHNSFWPGRILNDTAARYNPSKSYPAHATVDGVLGDQLWSTPLFQSLLELQSMGYSREQVDTIILEAQFGLNGGITMPIMARSIVQTAARLYPQGPHASVFFQQFANHNILKGALTVSPLVISAGGDTSIDPGETVSLKIPLSSDATSSDVTGTISVPSNFSGITLTSAYPDIQPSQTVNNSVDYSFGVPTDIACGTAFDLNFNYQATVNSTAITGNQVFNLTIGKPNQGSAVQNTPVDIPDNGPEVSSSLTVNEENTVVKNLKVRVDIEHTYVGDLIVTLESPTGTAVVLHSRSGGSQDNLLVTYPDDAAPVGSLSSLDGETLSGDWKLRVQDKAGSDIGKIREWELQYDTTSTCN